MFSKDNYTDVFLAANFQYLAPQYGQMVEIHTAAIFRDKGRRRVLY